MRNWSIADTLIFYLSLLRLEGRRELNQPQMIDRQRAA